jgi:(2Fe-2S) ferredoxin
MRGAEAIGKDRRIVTLDGHWYKRKTSRVWRRLAKQLLDDAPVKRPTRGWAA